MNFLKKLIIVGLFALFWSAAVSAPFDWSALSKPIDINKTEYSECLIKNSSNKNNILSAQQIEDACVIKATPKKCRINRDDAQINKCITSRLNANLFSKTLGDCSF
jgi:hypothetical protein